METAQKLKSWVDSLYFLTETEALWEVEALATKCGEEACWVQSGYQLVPWEKFWQPLVQRQDWYEEEEIAQAERYTHLVMGIEEMASEYFVVRKGRVEVVWYVVLVDSDGQVWGLKTEGVET